MYFEGRVQHLNDPETKEDSAADARHQARCQRADLVAMIWHAVNHFQVNSVGSLSIASRDHRSIVPSLADKQLAQRKLQGPCLALSDLFVAVTTPLRARTSNCANLPGL